MIAMVWPETGTATVQSLNDYAFTGIRFLGSTEKISWRKKGDLIEIDLPDIESKGLGYALEFIR